MTLDDIANYLQPAEKEANLLCHQNQNRYIIEAGASINWAYVKENK